MRRISMFGTVSLTANKFKQLCCPELLLLNWDGPNHSVSNAIFPYSLKKRLRTSDSAAIVTVAAIRDVELAYHVLV